MRQIKSNFLPKFRPCRFCKIGYSVHGDAGEYLRQAAEWQRGIIIPDSEFAVSGLVPDLKRVLAQAPLWWSITRPRGAAEMQSFVDLVKSRHWFVCCTVPVGMGNFWRRVLK